MSLSPSKQVIHDRAHERAMRALDAMEKQVAVNLMLMEMARRAQAHALDAAWPAARETVEPRPRF